MLTLSGLLSWLKALTCSEQSLLLLMDDPIKQFALFENTFGWTNVWGLNPESLG
jgi:hypothetical protein